MRKYKYMLAQFTFYDRTGIQKILEEKAEKGWLLDKVSNFGWRFRRIEPKKIHFAVTYFPKASAYDPKPSEYQQDLIDFCDHSGWKLIATAAQMQIFCNEMENPVPIETDPMIELENIHKSAKKNYLPAYYSLGILAAVQIALQVGQLVSFPLTYLSMPTTVFNWLCEIILLGMCLTEILGYFLWYRKAKAAAENGEFVETKGYRNAQLLFLGVICLSLLVLLLSLEKKIVVVMLIALVGMSGMVSGIWGIHGLLKKRGASASTNRLLTIGSTVLLTVLVIGLIFGGTIGIMSSNLFADDRVVGTYEAYGMEFDLYADEIPLKVEHLMELDTENYSYEARPQRSLLLSAEEYSQRMWGISDRPDLSYTVYTSDLSFIRDIVRKELLKPGDYVSEIDENGTEYYDVYVAVDAASWGAEEAWQKVSPSYAYRDYVLFFEDCIVRIRPGWEMTPEQMQMAGSILGN